MDPGRSGHSIHTIKKHGRVRGSVIGPNGEQLTSLDPYNTTVFVGGLSELVSEERLSEPFGDMHYVSIKQLCFGGLIAIHA